MPYIIVVPKVEATDDGAATLLSANTTQTFTHSLGAVPSAVLVTPQVEANIFVTAVTASDFTVSRGGLSTGDIDFYWHVRA